MTELDVLILKGPPNINPSSQIETYHAHEQKISWRSQILIVKNLYYSEVLPAVQLFSFFFFLIAQKLPKLVWEEFNN